MAVLCVIPARGGSKGIPGKNLRRVGGTTLVERAVGAARAAERIDTVVVSTDHDDIAAAALRAGAAVVRRPADLAADTASSESALVHAVEAVLDDPGADDILVFLQCTSPFIDPEDIDRAVAMVAEGGYDSVLAAVPSHAFVWREEPGGAVGVNHDWRVRLRRQDLPTEYRETGAIYAMRVAGFLETRHRFFGRVGICVVPEAHGIDIDVEDDLVLARFVAARTDPGPLAALDPSRVKALVTDFDGVHTDDHAWVDQDGGESVRVSRSDGLGLAALRDAGLPLLILSKERNPVVGARAGKLRIDCLQGIDDKLAALRQWADRTGIDPAGIVFVGNDSNDVPCLEFVGWPVVVADAHPSAHATGAMTTRRRGGAGALREIADRLLAGPGPYGWHSEE